jgi:hypothetical protein
MTQHHSMLERRLLTAGYDFPHPCHGERSNC